MQQFRYQSAAEYDAHVRQMLAAGWTMTHHQNNADGTVSATWAPPKSSVTKRLVIALVIIFCVGWLLFAFYQAYLGFR
jgi:hypothetical protein